MVQAGLRWRLEGGYSRFLEGSRVELRLEEGPLRQSLDISPFDLRDRSKPIEMTFRTARGFRGQGPEKLSWRVYPNGFIRSLILFPGQRLFGKLSGSTGSLYCPVGRRCCGGRIRAREPCRGFDAGRGRNKVASFLGGDPPWRTFDSPCFEEGLERLSKPSGSLRCVSDVRFPGGEMEMDWLGSSWNRRQMGPGNGLGHSRNGSLGQAAGRADLGTGSPCAFSD